jgi:amino acid permease
MESRNSFVDIELNEREMVEQPNEGQPKPLTGLQQNFLTKFLHSFGPREGAVQSSGDTSPVEGDTSPLKRSLKGRHLQFIAIGGSIGAGLFIGCGKALATGGPAWLLIAFSIVGIMLLTVMHALGELAAIYPISGSFAVFSSRFIDKSWGFAMGWNYAMQWLVVLPFVCSHFIPC